MRASSHKKLLKYLVDNGVKFNEKRRIIPTLTRLGFDEIGEGCYKKVFCHKHLFPHWVVKIYKRNSRDCNLKYLPRGLKQYYLKPVFQERSVMIQRKIRQSSRACRVIESELEEPIGWHCDIHSDNTGFLNGRPYFFDFLC